jgi:dTDP-4-dehydrorhamnose 3,5-epimerase-like enzyme
MQPYIIDFGNIGDIHSGYITFVENNMLPFTIKRVYWAYYSPQNLVRGNHAHRYLQQVVFAVNGQIDFNLENTEGSTFNFTLDNPQKGLFIPEMYWRTFKMSENAVLLCLVSLEYDKDDYIKDYQIFKQNN